MSNDLRISGHRAQYAETGQSAPPRENVGSGQSKGRKVAALISKFESKSLTAKKSSGPPSTSKSQRLPKQRSVKPTQSPKTNRVTTKSSGPLPPQSSLSTESTSEESYNYKAYVQKFGSKTANLYEIEKLGVQVPERSPISSTEVLDFVLARDTDGVIEASWNTMQDNGEVDSENLKKITDTIEEIFDESDYPFTTEQLRWIDETMAGKVLIARSTGDEDSADTPNAGGNESVLFVEPNQESVQDAMKEVVLSYFGADSLRNRIVGDGVTKVLADLPKMPVLLMEMISEPIKTSENQNLVTSPPVGIAMSTDKVEFTGGEDFHFVSISSAVGPGVNEGNGQVEVDETFVMQSSDGTPLLIYQKPSVKTDRIRAVKDETGTITNQLEKNSTKLAYEPSLSRDKVRSLVTSSDKIKTLNNGDTTEVEAVVGGDGTINFVQHRAIPDQRSNVDPTYVDTSKADGHSEVFQYTTVVPKSGDALVITDWSQVCFADTMKEAEAKFDWKGGSQKIVIVRQPDGSNSHPAVNFGSYKVDVDGTKQPNPIPCLVVPNYSQLVALKDTALSEDQPFVVDGQSQKAFVWTDTAFDADEAIQDGRISHHIGLETSVSDPDIKNVVHMLKTMENSQLSRGGSPELSSAFGALDPVLQQYAEKIEKYETLLRENSDVIHNAEGLQLRLDTIKANFAAVKDALTEVMKGNPQYKFDPQTHGRLLLVKFFESSMHEVDHFNDLIEAEKSASKYMQSAKTASLGPTKFADQVSTVKHSLTGRQALRWKRFLTLLEQADLSPKQVSDFKNMMNNLEKMGVTANWMSTVFDSKYHDIMPTDRTSGQSAVPAAKLLMSELIEDYSDTADFLAEQQALQKEVIDVERSMADFATPSKFDKAFAKLQHAAKPFIENEWPSDLNENPLKKAVQIENLGRLIEAFDGSIKTLKTSTMATDKLVAKEVEMLKTFLALFENLFKIDLPGDSAVPKRKSAYLHELKTAFNRIIGDIPTMDTDALELQSRCGADFNVTNALFSSQGKVPPNNLEEVFTTLHQGLEEIRSGLMVGGSDFDIDMPDGMEDMLAAVPMMSMLTVVKKPVKLVGREITSDGVSYTYNIMINDHGIKVRASHEKPENSDEPGKQYIEVDFYADNQGDRLKNMAKMATQFSFGTEPLTDETRRDVVWGAKQLKAKFEIRDPADLQRVTTLVNHLSAYSIAPRDGFAHDITSLKENVDRNNTFTSGVFPQKRKQVLTEFLNVTFGGIKSNTNDDQIETTTKDYKVQLVPTKELSFQSAVDGRRYVLDLEQSNFGLSDAVFDSLPQNVLDEAKQEVLQGSRKFAFESSGKTYIMDLNKSDLGLSSKEIKKLSLSGNRLNDLRKQLDITWDSATLYLRKEDDNKGFNSNWSEFVYGPPMSFSTKKGKMPEYDLWKSLSIVKGFRGDLGAVDKTLKKVLEKKYDLAKIENKVKQSGRFASPQDKLALATAYQDYYTELSKCEVTCSGYSKKMFNAYKVKKTNVHGRVFDLFLHTRVQKKAIEDQMLIAGLKPQELTSEQRDELPFSEYKLT